MNTITKQTLVRILAFVVFLLLAVYANHHGYGPDPWIMALIALYILDDVITAMVK